MTASLRAFALAGSFAVGILVADATRPGGALSVGFGVAGILALLVAWRLHRRAPPPAVGDLMPRLRVWSVVLVLAGASAVGFCDLGVRSAALRGVTQRLAKGAVSLEGRVASDPQPSGRATRFIVRSARIAGSRPAGRVLIRTFGPAAAVRMGDRVRVMGKARPLDRSNPFDERLYRRWVATQVTTGPSGVDVLAHTRNPVLRAANHLRERMSRAARISLGRADSGLLLGLVIGDERFMQDRLREDFRVAGLSHLTAVSGDVAMVLGAVVLLLRAARAPRRMQIWMGLTTVGFFAVVTRGEPSVLRAWMMASLALGALLFGRRSDALHGLALAFVALLAFDPFMLWSIGFQLSFAATLGLLVIAPLLRSRFGRLPRPVAEPLALGMGAQAAVTPLQAIWFGHISLVAVPANLAAAPLVAPATVLGLAGGVLGALWEPLGRPAIVAAGMFTGALRFVAARFAAVPHSSVAVPQLSLPQLAVGCMAIVAVVVWVAGRQTRRPLALTAIGALAMVVFLSLGRPAAPKGLRLTFFDVGQGEASLIESPAGARILVDGGPDPGHIASELLRRRIHRLDLVVVSHAHADHVNGLAKVLDRIQTRAVIDPGVPAPLIKRLSASVRPLPSGAGDRFVIGDVAVDVLSPDATLRAAAAEDETIGADASDGSPLNEASVVLRVGWGRSCALFTGDVEENAQQSLVTAHASQIDCTILKVPHHGSPRLLWEFAGAVDAEWATVSVGRNTYGHPSRAAMSMLEKAGARVLRTDRLDDIVLEMDRDGRVRLTG